MFNEYFHEAIEGKMGHHPRLDENPLISDTPMASDCKKCVSHFRYRLFSVLSFIGFSRVNPFSMSGMTDFSESYSESYPCVWVCHAPLFSTDKHL